MQVGSKLARIPKNTKLRVHATLCPLERCRAAMTIYALDILATATTLTRGHARYKTESADFVLGGLEGVDVGACPIVRTLFSEEVNVAQFELLDTLDFSLVVVFTMRINALASSVACDYFFAIGRLVNWRPRNQGSRSCCLLSPAMHCNRLWFQGRKSLRGHCGR